MPKFAPNLRWLFTELPLRERFAAAAKAGFDAIEFSPHDEIPSAELARLLADNGLLLTNGLTLLDWANGDRGNAGVPGREAEFRISAERSLEFATTCGMPYLHPPAGEVPAGADPASCRALYADNLAWLAERAAPLGVAIVFEPVCRARFPKFLLHTLEEGAAVIRATGRDDIKLVFDTYHVHMEEGAATRRFAAYRPHIAYVQIGNPPGRHEPGAGELDLHYFIELFGRHGYDDYIGLEYMPTAGTAASLAWTARYGVRPR
jgi:hydroxypyruvate isomerase